VGDATPDYQMRFPRQWAHFKAGTTQDLGGTPLNQLPWLTMGQIAEFNAVGVHTVEHLVNMSDAHSQKFMGHHQIKARAQAYLDAAKDSAPAIKLQAEVQKRDEQIAELTEANKTLMARLDALERASQKPAKA
jgi:hypothetical protein